MIIIVSKTETAMILSNPELTRQKLLISVTCGPKGVVEPMPGTKGVDKKCHYVFPEENSKKNYKKKPSTK